MSQEKPSKNWREDKRKYIPKGYELEKLSLEKFAYVRSLVVWNPKSLNKDLEKILAEIDSKL